MKRPADKLRDCILDLLRDWPSLSRFAAVLSDRELIETILTVGFHLGSGLRADAPSPFVSEARQLLSCSDSSRLRSVLRQWNKSLGPSTRTVLSSGQLEPVAIALLWQTCLICEYADRSNRSSNLLLGIRDSAVQPVPERGH